LLSVLVRIYKALDIPTIMSSLGACLAIKINMKFSILSALVAVAAASQIQLNTQLRSTYYTGLSSIHESAGINYFQVGPVSQNLTYDQESGQVYMSINAGDQPSYKMALIIPADDDKADFPQLQLSVTQGGNISWSVQGGKLVGTDSSGNEVHFFAGKNTGDPYNYSKNSFFVGGTTGNIFDYDVRNVTDLQLIDIDVTYL
jgi:hypothetical protein